MHEKISLLSSAKYQFSTSISSDCSINIMIELFFVIVSNHIYMIDYDCIAMRSKI